MDLLYTSMSQGIFPAIVVVIYLIAVKVIESKKEQLQTKLNSDLVNSITKIGNFVSYITENVINTHIGRCETAISNTFNCAAYNLIRFVVDTIIYNNVIENKESIIGNIKSLVTNEYYRIHINLDMYEIRGIKISNYLKEEWIEEIEQDIASVIYDEHLEKSQKILRFSSKINIKFQSYINYVITSVKAINIDNGNK